ncbi:unnamed protein product [Bemisia tabaci]|uniref:Uncharacterized protein n=1 Tax=Bemisia tabaci TaxID=7038 RepID=A0A9P0AG13_BEMTA|nr:unnamed protein product [Bemisia tabaci]
MIIDIDRQSDRQSRHRERGAIPLVEKIEREKADLSVQVLSLTERLEEAEGGAESQFEINKKRDTELAKLRKLLEDVHLESEETAHLLRKKHQEVVVDFQEQLDQLAKAKARQVQSFRLNLQAGINGSRTVPGPGFPGPPCDDQLASRSLVLTSTGSAGVFETPHGGCGSSDPTGGVHYLQTKQEAEEGHLEGTTGSKQRE